MKKLILLAFLLSTSSLWAVNDCDYIFQISNATLEVMDNSQVVQQNFTVYRTQNSPSGICRRYRVFFSKGLANNYQRRAFNLWAYFVNYNLHQGVNQAGILKEYGDAVSGNEYVEGTSPDRYQTYTNRFFVSVPGAASSVMRSGYYYDVVQATIYGYNENSGNYFFDTANNFTVLLYVPKKVFVSLVDEGGVFDAGSTSKVLDFGILEQNAERGADLRVTANGSYQLKLSSQNNGNLKISSGDSIAYTLRINGSSVSLSGSSNNPVTIGSGDTTSNQGDKFNLKVKISENVSNKPAGMYQDVVTITAIAN